MKKSATSHAICPGCGHKTATVRAIPEYHYQESGLDNVWLRGGVTETTCESCQSEFVRITKEPQLLQVVALTLLMEPGYRTGPELRFLRRACGLTQDDLARLLDLRRPTIAEREAKPNPGLGFAEDVGLRVVLVKEFQRYITRPGNNALDASHRKTLWDFANFLDKVTGDAPKKTRRAARITARALQDSWTVERPKKAA